MSADQLSLLDPDLGKLEFPWVQAVGFVKTFGKREVEPTTWFVIRTPAFIAGREHALYTNDPATAEAIFRLGPIAFEDTALEGRVVHIAVRELETLNGHPRYRSERWAPAKTFVLNRKSIEVMSEHTPYESTAFADSIFSDSTIPKVEQQFFNADFSLDGEKKCGVPEALEYMAFLGFSKGGEALGLYEYEYPIPSALMERIEQWKREHPDRKIYIPDFNFHSEFRLSSENFLLDYSNGLVPVSNASFSLYSHDTYSDHTMALLVYGQPLMQMLSWYSTVVLNSDEISFLIRPSKADGFITKSRWLNGKDKLDEAARVVDGITTKLYYLDAATPEINFDYLASYLKDITATLTDAGLFKHSILGTYMAERGFRISDPNPFEVLDALVQMSREQLGVPFAVRPVLAERVDYLRKDFPHDKNLEQDIPLVLMAATLHAGAAPAVQI